MRTLMIAVLVALAAAAWLARSGDSPAPALSPAASAPAAARTPAAAAAAAPVAAREPTADSSRANAALPPLAIAAASPAPPSRVVAPRPARENAAASAAQPAPRGPGVRELVPGSREHAQALASLIEGAQRQETVAPLARLYLAYFDRVPDIEGLEHYVGERDRGVALGDIAQEFAGSREFEQRYGALDDAAFVDRLYANVFGTPGDALQRAAWIAELESGRMSRGEVVLAFSEGDQFRALSSNEVFVAMAFAEAQRRAPDPAELARWVAFLEAGNARAALVERLARR